MFDTVTDSKGSRFGWAKPARVEEFAKLKGDANAHHQMMFKGEKIQLPIIKVSINLPKYRLENGRTSCAQEEYLAKNSTVPKDLFTADPELWTAQEAQHKLLLDMAKLSDLAGYFEDSKNIQTETILLDEYGFVVNGNRRLATWRELLHSNENKYVHFQYIEVAVLPHCDQKEIDRIEARLQITRDIRADYSWDARAKMLKLRQVRDGFSVSELAGLYDINVGEINELFDMLSYGEEYLKSRGKPGYWSLISKQEEAFRKIVQTRPKVASAGKKELFKELAFVLIDKPNEAGGRLYDQIPAIYTHLEKVTAKLLEKYPVNHHETMDDGLEDLLGNIPAIAAAESKLDLPLAKEINKPENIDNARELLVDVLETEKQLKKENKDANFLVNCCARAQGQLQAAVQALKPETKTHGVGQQLDSIEELITTIRAFLADNAIS
jgi:hypothetical protein